jgi:plastocyanin
MLSACAQDVEREARTHTVAIRGFQYAPESITVELGDTVVWRNQDIVPHTATAKAKGLDTGSIGANTSGQYVAKAKGTYTYDCTFHPTMKGTLVVR